MRVGLEDATVGGGVASGAEPCEPGVNEASTGAVHVDAEEEYMTTGKTMPNDSNQFRLARALTECSSRLQASVRSDPDGAQPGEPGRAAAPAEG
jgi:hypothetical protein